MKIQLRESIALGFLATMLSGTLTSGQSPSPAAPVTSADDCAADPDACLQEALETASDRASRLGEGIRVEPPEPFQGGQRTDTLANYMADTLDLVDGYWARLFGDVPYDRVAYSVIPQGGETVESSCVTSDRTPALASPDVGPFYCSDGGELRAGQHTRVGAVYIGLPGLVALLGRSGQESDDFAYVTIAAHELGHHVVEQLFGDQQGWTEPAPPWPELTADCLTGVFAAAAYWGEAGQLEEGDFDEAATLLFAIGNDLPYGEGGGVHGTREQRRAAFVLGYETARVADCIAATWSQG